MKFDIVIEAKTYENMCNELKKIHKIISSSTSEEEGKGAAFYFVIKDPLKPSISIFSSLCKLKTL